MFIKKIEADLQEALEREGFKEATLFQKTFLSKINSGKDVIGVGSENSGRSMALLIAALHKLKKAYEQAARAVIVVETDEKVLELAAHFEKLTRFSDLRIDAITNKVKVRDQIDWIWEGTDLIIGTPERLHTLYLQNGINMTQLLLFAIDDADKILRVHKNNQTIERLLMGLPKCQKLVCTGTYSLRLKKAFEEAMPFPEIVEVK